jgi:3',5'-cyclic AMP phosphodiesterase CpdA
MIATRLGFLSDLHLSRARPFFHANWELLLRELDRAPPPDRFIVTGDIALDGPVREDDLAFARAQLDRLPAPWHALPGNHDIGINPPDIRGEALVTAERLAAWRRHFGADFWHLDLPGWRLVALDSLIPGSGLAAEAEQAEFLDAALAGADGRQVMLLTHKPLCIHDMLETTPTTNSWTPEGRRLVAPLLRAGRIALVVSGHLHESRDRVIEGVRHLWLPGLAFVNDMACEWQPPRGGRKRVGHVTLELGVEAQVSWHEPHALLNTDIGNWLRTGGIGLYAALAGDAEPYPGLFPQTE